MKNSSYICFQITKHMKKLQLEVNAKLKPANDTFRVGNGIVMITPSVGEDYWLFRVKLHANQAILGFPKFGVIGVGFAQEEDWNTNLPSTVDAERIYEHIKHNKGHKEITKAMCLQAIRMIQNAAKALKTQSN